MKAKIHLIAAATILAGCATQLSDSERQLRTEKMFKEGFSKGNKEMAARVVTQDELQSVCSKYPEKVPEEIAARLQKTQQATIRYPASGGLIGDWRQGEKIAQDGWGLRFTDTGSPKRLNGGNCYACHQVTKEELAYGTLGPSLYNFAKVRGYGPDIQKYAWGKVYNSHAFSACSSMPRFGAQGILTEQQIKDVVALLMDPNSPVNK